MDTVLKELNGLDRDMLMGRMARELPLISGEMDSSPKGIACRAGLDEERVSLIVSGKRKMKWSEYLCILFVLWDDEKGREMVERTGLFPEGLKKAMSVNRNTHAGSARPL